MMIQVGRIEGRYGDGVWLLPTFAVSYLVCDFKSIINMIIHNDLCFVLEDLIATEIPAIMTNYSTVVDDR